MKSKKLAKSKPGPATQKYLDIAEIRENMVILRDGTVRGVLLVSSVNFALKSQDEQQAIIQSYMQFLNGLEYPIQIVVQSRKMNMDAYLTNLQEKSREMDNELLRNQIRDYMGFVRELVELGDIMTKRFYVVVPYDPITDKKRGFFSRFFDVLRPSKALSLSKKQYEDRKKQLAKRVSFIRGSLNSMGLSSVMLDTAGLIELYYKAYNPETAEVQKLSDVNKQRIEDAGTVTI